MYAADFSHVATTVTLYSTDQVTHDSHLIEHHHFMGSTASFTGRSLVKSTCFTKYGIPWWLFLLRLHDEHHLSTPVEDVFNIHKLEFSFHIFMGMCNSGTFSVDDLWEIFPKKIYKCFVKFLLNKCKF